jgi:polyisoprenyl-phosphate glycosyltransferase
MKPLISIVIPIYNEELVIPELCKRLSKLSNSLTQYTFEIIMVENGSYDSSFKKLVDERKKDKRIKILKLVKNEGTDGGIFAGLSFATGAAAVTMTADLQDSPEVIAKFLEKWQQGYEIVYGIVTKREKVKITRQIETYLYYKFIKLITSNLVKENASDFRLLDKKVYTSILNMPEHDKFLRGLIIWTGFKHIGIQYKRPPRFAGESKAYFTTAMKVALNGLFSFSPIPFYVAFLFSIISYIICFLLLIFRQFSFAISSFFYASLFLVLGIILEYVRRIYVDLQNRPQFIVREKIGL